MTTPILYGPNNQPLKPSNINPYGTSEVSRLAGGLRGTLSNWFVSRNTEEFTRRTERQLITDRAEDLTANDPHAASAIDSIAINSVGTGLLPQSTPNAKILNWTPDQVKDFQTQAEWAWHIWQDDSDAAGRLKFWQNCLVAVRTMLVKGEFFRIPIMTNYPNQKFSMKLQSVDPLRVYTPSDLTEKNNIKDGIEYGKHGRPTAYWVANPQDGFIDHDLSSQNFTKINAHAGHRPGLIHNFVTKSEEQVRGVSILAPAMKFFKDLNDYLDFELVGAIIASSFPVFIETVDPQGVAQGFNTSNENDPKNKYQETAPGAILYGNVNEKPHILKSDRPSNSFDSFVERILRAIGASIGMPYEVIAKDFSKTNYSSARAALLEAWRVYAVYQKWMIDGFCQPVWRMVLEEAWLRGMIKLPKNSPDWYEQSHAYTKSNWIPPKKGNVDPLKEIKANILAIQHNISTLANVTAESGGGDYETNLEQRNREKTKEKELGLTPPAEVKQEQNQNAEPENNNNQSSNDNTKG